jgi:ProP effector
MKSNHAEVAATIALLCEQWPKCFALLEYRRRPLKLRIDLELQAALDGAVTPRELTHALSAYCGNVGYLRASWEGAWRIDLAGNPVGIVTAEEAAHAKEWLTRTELKKARRAEAAAKQKAEEKKAAAAPAQAGKRLGLADLKAMGRARRPVASPSTS